MRLAVTDYNAATDFVDLNNDWTAAEFNNSNNDNAALDAHWGAEKFYDYFYNVRGRNSWNDLNGSLLSYVNANLTYFGTDNNNAFWDGSRITLGKGASNNPYVSLDVIAHEFSHGIFQTDVLGGATSIASETAALDEGLSDIWAACIKQWAAPSKPIWVLGTELVAGGSRSMSDPKSKNQPNTYGGTYWVNTSGCSPNNSNDYCGGHTNMSVLSYWFYLLTMGGSGTNDVGTSYKIQGLGFTKSSAIVYRAERFGGMTNTVTYATARNAMIQAATDLYGANSCEVLYTTNAWNAVGVGSGTAYPSGITGSNVFCTSTSGYSIGGTAPAGTTIIWSASGTISISGGNTGSSVTVQKTGNGYGTLTASLQSNCGSLVIATKQIYTGLPIFPTYTTSPNPICDNQDALITFNLGPSQTITSATGNQGGVQVPLSGGGNTYTLPADIFGVTLTISNSCGTVTLSKLIRKASCGGLMVIYPNPADNQLTVDFNGQQSQSLNKTSSAESKSVKLFNKNGVVLRSVSTKENQITFDISKIAKGTYYLQVVKSNGIETKQVIIQH